MNNNTDSESVVKSKCYDIEKLQGLKISNKNKSLSLFYVNAYSLNKNFDDIQHFLSCTNKNFDIKAINEIRITKNTSITGCVIMKNCFLEFTPVQCSVGGSILCIVYHLSYKSQHDLKLMSAIFYPFFIFSSSDRPSKTEKCFLFYLKSSSRFRGIEIFVIFSLPFDTAQIQKGKWKWNNL